MTRIIAGVAKGRRLTVPPGRATRPTAERTREALFSSLESLRGPLAGARVLDLYAGSGAFGLEAASRGAAHVLLVESDAKAVAALRRNAAAVALSGVEIRHDRVARALATPPPARYDVALADPPYDLDAAEVDAAITALVENRWLEPEAVVVVERSRRGAPVTWPGGVESISERRYGEGLLWYGRAR